MKALTILSIMALLAGCSSPPCGSRVGSPPRFSAEGLKTISVGVYGAVAHPQVYVLPEGSGVLEAVRQNAGFTAWSFLKRVRVDRSGGLGHGGTSYVVNLRRAMQNRNYDLRLKDGDTVLVPRGLWVYEGRPKELRSCPEYGFCPKTNYPAAGKAGIVRPLALAHYCYGLPEPKR